MSEQSKSFSPHAIEPKWLKIWDEKECFKANTSSSKPPYSIVIPPPNVTGNLHMGHALVDTLQDVLIRWKRMSGFETLWLPGTDHAGIATQTVVERHLMRTEGKKRVDYARDDFLAHVWDWKEKHEGNILGQLKKLGCSCDFSRLCFTMDEKRSRAVKTLFKKMYDDGLIYRGDYLVNWDPVTQTALADDEVEYEEREDSIWYIKYPHEDGETFITVATTRPETMLGDVAVAVSEHDPRYSHLIGTHLILPIVGRKIPVIGDRMVDPEFGTGAVKITPAHDPNDYQVGLNHNLEMINLMTPDGKMNDSCGEFASLSMEEARVKVAEKLEKKGFLEKVVPHTHRVGVSYRSKAVIEPYLSKQWFVKLSAFKDDLRQAVEKEEVKLIPKRMENSYFPWIDNLRDWCISRQLWWGHRIPIWYNKENPEEMICFDGEGEPEEVKNNPDDWTQDEDVLDTWFSSALWPFSTMGWPENTGEMEKFYPNSVLVTGHDILFFWVARMIMVGKYATNKMPFPETFLHGLIYGKSYWTIDDSGSLHYITGAEKREYDLGKKTPINVQSKWEKMSKSKGNVLDPLEMIDNYGTDAVRLTLCMIATPSPQIDLDMRKFEDLKNFTNKIWNGARFVFMNIEDLSAEAFSNGLDIDALRVEDHWIIGRLKERVESIENHLNSYEFDHATSSAYQFFWDEFCAYYLEIAKPILFKKYGTDIERRNKQIILTVVLSTALRLMHPFAPFITEELFEKLREQFKESCINEKSDSLTQECVEAFKAETCATSLFPKSENAQFATDVSTEFTQLEKCIHTLRNIRAEMQIHPSTRSDLFIVGSDHDVNFQLLKENEVLLRALIRLENIDFVTEKPTLNLSSDARIGDVVIVVPLPEEMIAKEKERLMKEKEKLVDYSNRTRSQLANEAFLSKAPPQLVNSLKEKLETTLAQLELATKKLDSL